MILAYLILIPLLFVSLWVFFKSSPKTKIYNLVACLLAIVFSGGYSLKLRTVMINTIDFAWWPVLASIFSLFISISTLLVAGIIQNFILFKNPRNKKF